MVELNECANDRFTGAIQGNSEPNCGSGSSEVSPRDDLVPRVSSQLSGQAFAPSKPVAHRADGAAAVGVESSPPISIISSSNLERASPPGSTLPSGPAGQAIEIGSALSGLAKPLAQRGLPTLVVEHIGGKRVISGPTIRMDLRVESGWATPFEILAGGTLALVFIELPRGTALKPPIAKAFAKSAVRMRSRRHPSGRPGLTAQQAQAVQSANSILHNVARFVLAANKAGVLLAVGSPLKSALWGSPALAEVLSLAGFHSVTFPLCAFGGKALRWHRLWTNMECLAGLQSACSCVGPHAPPPGPGYPDRLRVRLSELLIGAVTSKGIHLGPSLEPIGASHAEQALSVRAAAGRQPRGSRYPPLIPEYKQVLDFDLPPQMSKDLNLRKGMAVTQLASKALRLPPSSKVLEASETEGGGISAKIGVHLTWQEFNSRAADLRHPFDNASGVDPDTIRAAFSLFTLGPTAVQDLREAKITHYMKRAAQLAPREKALKNKMSEFDRGILDQKRIFFISGNVPRCRHQGRAPRSSPCL